MEDRPRVESDVKYVICNADEGDPGAFMDRSVLEGDPHAVMEGMLIGSFAIGADEGFIYVRSEYPLAVSTITHAISRPKRGPVGRQYLRQRPSSASRSPGAGAFVCGEETALIASLEGHSGEPQPRPPFPAVKALGQADGHQQRQDLGQRGADPQPRRRLVRRHGTERNRGTTVFALVGAVKNTGLVEVPLGITLREMVFEIGGGMREEAAAQGGPDGRSVRRLHPRRLLDLTIDYEKRPRRAR